MVPEFVRHASPSGAALSGAGQERSCGSIRQLYRARSPLPGHRCRRRQDRTGVTDTTIKIGVPAPLTGPNASFGAASYGIQAYYKCVNEKGGVHGRKIELIVGDHACNEAKGVAVAKKLISQDQVFLINGGVCSGVALAMRPVIEEAGVPWVVSTAVNQKISAPLAKNIFHASQTSEAAGHALANFMLSKRARSKIGVIAHTNEWSKGYRDPMVAYLKEQAASRPPSR